MKSHTAIAAMMMLCLGAGMTLAQDAPQILRQDDMKLIGRSMGQLGAIAKGQQDYDPVVVEGALSSIASAARDFPGHFPDGSQTGNATEASPAIWQNMADFTALSDKLASQADALLADLPEDQTAVGQAMQTLGANCGACHRLYRVSN